MKVSIDQVKEVLRKSRRDQSGLTDQTLFTKPLETSEESKLIRKVRDEVLAMPDVREELVAELKARIESGQYDVSADAIVDSMIRREIADQIR